jgi:hypothetical protein
MRLRQQLTWHSIVAATAAAAQPMPMALTSFCSPLCFQRIGRCSNRLRRARHVGALPRLPNSRSPLRAIPFHPHALWLLLLLIFDRHCCALGDAGRSATAAHRSAPKRHTVPRSDRHARRRLLAAPGPLLLLPLLLHRRVLAVLPQAAAAAAQLPSQGPTTTVTVRRRLRPPST